MPQDGDAAAAAAASADDLVPAIWNASENEALCQTEFDVPEDWQPSGDFAKDYLFYVKLLGILPHPDLWRVKRPRARLFEDGEFVENDEAEDDEDDFDQSDAPSSVAIRHHNVDAATLKAMCLVLPSTLSLVQLRFYNAGLTAVDLNMVVKALSGSSVTSLSIEYNPLSDIAPIQDQEAKITGEVDDAPKTSEGAEAANSDEDIRDNAGVDPSTQFAACLDLPIASLSLRGNGITPSGAAAIAKKLYDHKTLNSLNLFDNNIEGEGAQVCVAGYNSHRCRSEVSAMLWLCSCFVVRTGSVGYVVLQPIRDPSRVGSQQCTRGHSQDRLASRLRRDRSRQSGADKKRIRFGVQ